MKFKKLKIILLTIFILFACKTIVNAAEITYKTEYYNGINTAIYVKGLDENLEEQYSYKIHISQDNTIEENELKSKATAAQYETLFYDEENKEFYKKTSQYFGIFEKTGDYYAYILKGKVANKDSWELIDGPTKLERPLMLPIGKRINVYYSKNSTNHFIRQNAYYTKLHGTERKVKFHLGELKDTNILQKLNDKTEDAYDLLYDYGKDKNKWIYEGEFDTTATEILDYNIFKDYKEFQEEKHYFVFYELDTEDGKYIEVNDVEAYTYKVVGEDGWLDKFSNYTPEENKEEDATPKEENKAENTGKKEKDTTVAKKPIPQTGATIIGAVIASIILIATIIFYIKYIKYRDLK